MAKYVIDDAVVLHLLEHGDELPAGHQFLAPTLIRSHVLEALYGSVRDGTLTEADGLSRLGRFATMKIRYLGDKVLRRQAWKVADQLGWDSTGRAEYVALTQLQADALVTLDRSFANSVESLVATISLQDLLAG